jgi:catechol 2,3-dioxygenase-like lactoylglutathione lyase family enzyme
MPASLAFYRDVLGFEIVHAAPRNPPGHPDNYGWVLLRHGHTELMLNSAYDPDDQRPPAPDAGRVAAHDDTALYIGAPDVEAVYRHLRDHGLEVAPPAIAYYGMKQLHLKDPDGFTVCFQWAAEAPVPARGPH